MTFQTISLTRGKVKDILVNVPLDDSDNDFTPEPFGIATDNFPDAGLKEGDRVDITKSEMARARRQARIQWGDDFPNSN